MRKTTLFWNKRTTGEALLVRNRFSTSISNSIFFQWRWCELRKYTFKYRYDRRIGHCNLSNCKINPKKKKIGTSTGLEFIASALALGAVLYQLNYDSMKTHTLGAGQFVDFILTQNGMKQWRWCELRKYTFKWRYDRSSGNCNLSTELQINKIFSFIKFLKWSQTKCMKHLTATYSRWEGKNSGRGRLI